MTEKSIDQLLYENAVQAAEEFQWATQVPLDFSPESMPGAEEVVAAAAVGGVDEETGLWIVNLVGSYILHVAFTEHGGHFEMYQKRPQPVLVVGQPKFSVAMMAMDKVAKRLGGNPTDNLALFYDGFVQAIERAKPGSNTLIA